MQGADPAAIADPSFRPLKADAGRAVFDEHLDAIGIGVLDGVLLGRVVETRVPEGAFGIDFDGAAIFGIIGPLGRVEEVRAPVRDDPTGVVTDPATIKVQAVSVVGGVGRGSQPRILVQFGRAGHGVPAGGGWTVSVGVRENLVRRGRGPVCLRIASDPIRVSEDDGVHTQGI